MRIYIILTYWIFIELVSSKYIIQYVQKIEHFQIQVTDDGILTDS